eukprot:scaffold119251_cov45-Phaeocystis_antarctica.AAC.1
MAWAFAAADHLAPALFSSHVFVQLCSASSLADMSKVRGRSVDGARPEGLSPRSEIGLRLAVLAALQLALAELGGFVFRTCASS